MYILDSWTWKFADVYIIYVKLYNMLFTTRVCICICEVFHVFIIETRKYLHKCLSEVRGSQIQEFELEFAHKNKKMIYKLGDYSNKSFMYY